MTRVLFTPAARTEIADIIAFIEARSPAGARRVAARFKASFDLLAERPGIGRPTNVRDLRRLPVRSLPFLVFYRVRKDAVVVIAVRHGRRRPASMPAL